LESDRLSEDMPLVVPTGHIEFDCDACGKQFSVPPDFGGKKAKFSWGKILDI